MKKIFRSDQERSEWLLQLAALLKEGFPLSEALVLLKTYQRGNKGQWCEIIYQSLLNGDDLSAQLEFAGFSKDIISYLYFHEKYGDLKYGLETAAILMEKKYESMEKVRKILFYPFILFLCLIVMATIISRGVLPQIQTFFQSMNQDLPWVTRFVISLLSLFEAPILLGFTLLLLLFLLWLRKLSLYDRLKFLLKLPLIKLFTRSLMTYYLTSHLSPLLKNGFSLYKALKVMEEHSKINFLQQEAQVISFQLMEGTPFTEIIRERKFYEPQLVATIGLGEAKGALGDELERYTNFLQRQYYEGVQNFMALLQPILYTVIGVIVMILFLSMMLPIFNIVDGW
ncbi:competence protein ComGB [Evansella vedderi]|uniref:Competence protein ComGB n=1 Tax=Evansella vedderi TaxID=38282 RepID=A0ABT9ZYH5_9BACI|nr:competence type IV pilus assembly protein ComGB [Evansella vedderi]MDQ0256288.1 competence protein ComGB [Evansella vedderi]